MDEICQGCRIKTETLLRYHGNEAGTGLEIWIVELAITLILLEVGGIRRGEESAQMMIEPPGNLWRTGIFEINDRIFVTVKMLFVKQGDGAVQ